MGDTGGMGGIMGYISESYLLFRGEKMMGTICVLFESDSTVLRLFAWYLHFI